MMRPIAIQLVTVECTRVFYEDGERSWCEGDVEIPIRILSAGSPATWEYPGDEPECELGDVPTACTHARPPVPYTPMEQAALQYRAERALDRFEPRDQDDPPARRAALYVRAVAERTARALASATSTTAPTHEEAR